MLGTTEFGVTNHGERADCEQAAEIAIALFGDVAELLFTSARVLLWYKPDQAEKSRPDRNTLGSATLATRTVANAGPPPKKRRICGQLRCAMIRVTIYQLALRSFENRTRRAREVVASTFSAISVATFFSRLIRKCVAPIRIFSVANGCSTVWRRTRIACGFLSRRVGIRSRAVAAVAIHRPH
jgi:hypothetical protein